jgi:Domain of unknown function (DUF4394)
MHAAFRSLVDTHAATAVFREFDAELVPDLAERGAIRARNHRYRRPADAGFEAGGQSKGSTMRVRTAGVVAVVVAAGLTLAPGIASAQRSTPVPTTGSGNWSDWKDYRKGLDAVGLTDGGKKLVRFDTKRPDRAKAIAAVTGLAGDTMLIGIDYRVQNGKLYGVGNSGGIYLVSDRDAKASKVGQLTVALSGTAFGVDFNPAANALRVVSDNGQNLRQPFATGDAPSVPTVADTALTSGGVAASGISAAAYTNNDLSTATATSLFDLDTALDQVVLQSPANAGTVVATGSFGVAADLDAGLDIYSKVRGDRAVEVTAFATLGVNGAYKLYEVDLLTGVAASKGGFKFPVTDIAVQLNQR